MIQTTTDRKWLPLYEALASDVRLTILELLAEEAMNVKDLAARLALSSAIVTMHVKKLEAGGLIHTKLVRKQGGTHKICSLALSRIDIQLPQSNEQLRLFNEVTIPVGHYTRYEVHPTCGLATAEHLIGQFDDPRYFFEPERMYARILWFSRGFVEYQIPNYMLPGQSLEEIEISLELGSEAPGIAMNWPSDIHFYVNNTLLGYWTSPGDSGDGRGTFTPSWWSDSTNQYGWLKVLRITEEGTFLDGQQLSAITIQDLPVTRNMWTLRLEVPEQAEHVGGLTIYGEGFGNYNQDIRFRTYRR